MSKGEVSANGTTYNESNVTANKDLSFTSGKDTNIKGGNLSGEKVTGNVGGSLNIESKQDSNSYKENNKSVGASVGLGSNKAVSGSASVGKIDSKYESVTDQSGIYAGKEGFDIRVEANTDLNGGIISSTADADKNKFSTGTLTFEDIQNKADYKAGGAGIKVNKNNDAEYNEKGITPDIGMPASGESESTTKATISKGTIEIRDKENQKQDINKLNRDNQNSLNRLGEIFDKTKIEERQELANLFGELAYNEIHYMDGSNEQKALYHAVVGGIMSKLTGGDFLAGATAAGINKLVIEEIDKVAGGDPDKAQWVSAVLGAVISGLVSGNTQAGASVAASATKNNFYHLFFKKYIDMINPNTLKENEAYAIMVDGSYKYVDGTVGCFITLNPDDSNDLLIFDNTGVNIALSGSNNPVGMSVTKIIFANNVKASDIISGASISAGADINGLHIGGSMPISDLLEGNLNNFSGEYGISLEMKASIQAGMSYAYFVGSRSSYSTWHPFKELYHKSYDEAVDRFISNPLKGKFDIFENKETHQKIVLKIENNNCKMLSGYDEKNNTYVWVDINRTKLSYDDSFNKITLCKD